MAAAPRSLLRLGFVSVLVALFLFFVQRIDPSTTDRVHRALTSSASVAAQQDRIDLAIKLQVLKQLLHERFPLTHWTTGRQFNEPALDRLSECTLAANCGPGEHTVVVLGSYHYGNSQAGHVSGEDIWAHSSIVAFQALNYTLLYAYSAMEVLQIYQQIPDLVPIIIMEGAELTKCAQRNATNEYDTGDESVPGLWQSPERIGCIKRKGFEEGIPIWKIFALHFWQGTASPIGQNWTLSPEDYESWQPGRGNNYIGYSVEDRCTKVPVHSEREHRALILAKNVDMLQGEDFAWEGLLHGVAKELPKSHDHPFQFVSTAGRSVAEGGPDPLPEKGVVSMGKMDQMKWWNEVAKSKAMLGVGRPFTSPSPYDAMCFGVPFINVCFWRDESDKENKRKWYCMHDALWSLEPPYVYHVFQGDKDGLEEALEHAIKHPIGRFIPPWMTLEAVRERHRGLVERDWRSVAEDYFAREYKDGKSPFLL